MKKRTLVLTYALRGKDLEHFPDEMFALSTQKKNSSIFSQQFSNKKMVEYLRHVITEWGIFLITLAINLT